MPRRTHPRRKQQRRRRIAKLEHLKKSKKKPRK